MLVAGTARARSALPDALLTGHRRAPTPRILRLRRPGAGPPRADPDERAASALLAAGVAGKGLQRLRSRRARQGARRFSARRQLRKGARRFSSTPSPAKAFDRFQHDVTVDDVTIAHREGFRSVEHLKRYTTLGMATRPRAAPPT